MDSIKAYIEDFAKNFEIYLYPDSLTPVYQVVAAFAFGLFFGAYHYAFLWTIISYSLFELIFAMCTAKRPKMYIPKYRLLAILMGFIGILFSKIIWGFYNPPLFRFFPY